MSKITIDPNILIQAITEAIQSATQILVDEKIPTSKKRGRPKKIVLSNDTIIESTPLDEDEQSLLNEPETPFKKKKEDPNIFHIQRKNIEDNTQRKRCISENVTVKKQNQIFIDLDSVKHEKENWEPSGRRQAAQMIKFHCSRCNQDFDDYPSNHPEAFFAVAGGNEGNQQGSIFILCNKCGVR